MFIVTIWRDVLEKSGLAGVLLLAAYVALAFGTVFWLAYSIAAAAVRTGLRAFRRWQLRRELRVLRGGRLMFTDEGDLVERPPRPPIRSLRKRGDDDAAA